MMFFEMYEVINFVFLDELRTLAGAMQV